MSIVGVIGNMLNESANADWTAAGKSPSAPTGKDTWSQLKARELDLDFQNQAKDKDLSNNIILQNKLNELQKDFQDWAIENEVKWGSDEEKLEAIKKYQAARGNDIMRGWGSRIFDAVSSFAPMFLMKAVFGGK